MNDIEINVERRNRLMKKEHIVFSLLVLLSVGFCPSLSLARETESLDKNQIIQSVRENYSLFDSVEYKVEKELFLETSKGFLQVLKTCSQIRFDEEKCWMRSASYDDETATGNVRIREKLIDSDGVMLLMFRSKNESQGFSLKQHKYTSIPHDVIDAVLSSHDSNDDLEYSVLSWLTPVKSELYPYEISGAFEKGLFLGDGAEEYAEYIKITELMEQSSDVLWDQQKEKTLVLFRGNDDSGSFCAWFDPECHYLLVKFRYAANKISYGDKLSVYEYQVIDKSAQGDNFYPCKYEVKDYLCPMSEPINNTLTNLTVANLKEQWLFTKIICTLSACNFSPKFDESSFRFTRPIENYTSVGMQDAKQIRYIWLDGKIVPWTDETALARARGHRFISGPDEPRFWLMAMGLAMIIFALSTKIYNYIQSKKGNE